MVRAVHLGNRAALPLAIVNLLKVLAKLRLQADCLAQGLGSGDGALEGAGVNRLPWHGAGGSGESLRHCQSIGRQFGVQSPTAEHIVAAVRRLAVAQMM